MSVGIRVYWAAPVDEDVATYELYMSATKDGPAILRASISADVEGPNYQKKSARYFFDDLTGMTENYYQVVPVASTGVALPDSGWFKPYGPIGSGTPARVKVDHDYGEPDALRFVTQAGVGIPDAEIHVYYQTEYEQGSRESPLYVVKTRADGRWDRPLLLEPGLSYVLLFVKTSAYASDPVTILV